MQIIQNRRRFLAGAAAAGAAGLSARQHGRRPRRRPRRPPFAFRHSRSPTAWRRCTWPQDLLRAEGFTEIRW